MQKEQNKTYVIEGFLPGDAVILKNRFGGEIKLTLVSPRDFPGDESILVSAQPPNYPRFDFPEGQIFQIGNLTFRCGKFQEFALLNAHGHIIERESCH